MTKWFDTNYHYMVRVQQGANVRTRLAESGRRISRGEVLGYQTRPVLLGPVTFLKLGKSKDAGFDPLSLLPKLLPVYIDMRAVSPPTARSGCNSTSRASFSISTRRHGRRCAGLTSGSRTRSRT